MKHGYIAVWAKEKKTGKYFGIIPLFENNCLILSDIQTWVLPRQISDGTNGWCNQNSKFNDLTYIPRKERPNADLVEYFEKTNIRLEGQMLNRMLRNHFDNYFFEKKANGKIRYQLFYVDKYNKHAKELNPKDYEFIITKALGKNAPYKLNEKVIKGDKINKMEIKAKNERI